jgi:hypothetical protein
VRGDSAAWRAPKGFWNVASRSAFRDPPLQPAEYERFSVSWSEVQRMFVDNP